MSRGGALANEVHVYPEADLVDHELTLDCVCGPHLTPHLGVEVVTHHSLDGRELAT
ncbi:MAG: hypothetical protein ACRDUY_03740 [Nitriliruptorales bacterium]